MSFYFRFRRPKGGSTLRDFHVRDGRAAPASRFSPAAKTLVRRTHAAAQKDRLAVFLQRSRPSKISILAAFFSPFSNQGGKFVSSMQRYRNYIIPVRNMVLGYHFYRNNWIEEKFTPYPCRTDSFML